MAEYALLVVSAIFVNNVVFSRFLGLCPYFGVSKKIDTAMGMGMAVTFVLTLAGSITYIVQIYILNPLNLGYLQTIAFILVIASTVQLTEMAVQKLSPTLYQGLGIFLPLITTNCAVLGLAVLNIQREYSLVQVIFHSIGAAGGFAIALLLFAGLREKMETLDTPEVFKGPAIALITAGILSLAFMGFSGLA